MAHICVCYFQKVPSSEEAVTPSSAMTPSASGASSRPFIPVTDDPGAASIIAETMTKTKEVSLLNSLRVCHAPARLCHILEPALFFRTLSVRVKWSDRSHSTSMSSQACLFLTILAWWWICSNWQCPAALVRRAGRCCLLCCLAWVQLIHRWLLPFSIFF